MRGTRARQDRQQARPGIIPAYAGNTSRRIRSSFVRWDHPRVCGEHTLPARKESSSPGSSPRMRGTQRIHVDFPLAEGIIPAYAGNTFGHSVGFTGNWDHPRVCGEHSCMTGESASSGGSSPRMRGTHRERHRGVARLGIIPAYAGNTPANGEATRMTWDHPRVCGEHPVLNIFFDAVSGSSPRMRGTRVRIRRSCQWHGIIPAYAGNTYQPVRQSA